MRQEKLLDSNLEPDIDRQLFLQQKTVPSKVPFSESCSEAQRRLGKESNNPATAQRISTVGAFALPR